VSVSIDLPTRSRTYVSAAADPGLPSLLAWAVRRRHRLLLAWTAVWFAAQLPAGGISWHYFVEGSQLLFGAHPPGMALPGGLHVYANYPQLQIGPLSFLAAWPFAQLGPTAGRVLAAAAMTAAGPALVLLVERLAGPLTPARPVEVGMLRLKVLLAGTAVLPLWVTLSVRFGHLDDALALLLAVLAVRALATGNPLLVGVLLGLSVDAKPWAAPFVALALALPAGRRRAAVLWAAATAAVAWLPFVLADPRTMDAGRFTIPNVAASGLRVLGVTDAATPWWDRPAQVALGVALAWYVVRRGGWAAVLLLGVDARILLDPSVYPYYTAGVLVAAMVYDVLGSPLRLPVWTLLGVAALYLSLYAGLSPHQLGLLRVGFVLACVTGVLAASYRTFDRNDLVRSWRGAPSTSRGGPLSTTTPPSMNTSESPTSRAKPISWVTTTMVMPSSASPRMTSSTSPTSSGSSAEVGSSNSMSLGRIASARAMATRCCCPPESWDG